MATPNLMPSTNQTWAHSVVSKKKLNDTLLDDSITAIESDILMGYEVELDKLDKIHNKEEENISDMTAIMAHPPDKHSDLTMRQFLTLCTAKKQSGGSQSTLKKHIKLDFKEVETVVPTLKMIDELAIDLNENDGKVIILNADILPGPAMRSEEPTINSDEFMKLCLENSNDTKYVYSLSWRTDPRSYGGYTDLDIDVMMNLIDKYGLVAQCIGIVFAVNARVLVQDCKPFNKLLSSIESSQLLVWTATGEPPISQRKIDSIKEYFETNGYLDRIGFDCQVASSLSGLFNDWVVNMASAYFYAKRWFS